MPMIALLALLLAGAGPAPVSVAYAGSLVHSMEGAFAQGLARDTGITFQGEAKGSRALANLIAAGLRQPDVFISADISLLERLRTERAPKIRSYTVFGSARMVIAYSPNSPHAALFDRAAHAGDLLALLTAPSIRIGRTDPQLDPKGSRTLETITLLGSLEHAQARARTLVRDSQVFPEEDLAVRVETGQLDAGFFYSTETPGRGLRIIELAHAAGLSNEITYGVAVLRDAPHPKSARAFVRYLLGGNGRAILEAGGVKFFARPRVVGAP